MIATDLEYGRPADADEALGVGKTTLAAKTSAVPAPRSHTR
jgi:hypothetical protein